MILWLPRPRFHPMQVLQGMTALEMVHRSSKPFLANVHFVNYFSWIPLQPFWNPDAVHGTATEVPHLSCLNHLSIQARCKVQQVAKVVVTLSSHPIVSRYQSRDSFAEKNLLVSPIGNEKNMAS